MRGRIAEVPQRELGGGWRITFEVDDARQVYEQYKDKDLTVEVAQFRQKRSLDANAYCWSLLGKIADKLKTDKDSVYLTMLKRYGQGGVVKIKNEQVEMFRRAWKYNEPHESLPPEAKAQYFRFWVGSSNYSTHEMSIFIDGIISEAKELGIDTLTPEQRSLMLEEWGR